MGPTDRAYLAKLVLPILERLHPMPSVQTSQTATKFPFRLQRVYLSATASRLLPAGWSSRVIRMQIVSVHPLGDEAIILMPDQNLRCMTVLSVLFG